MAGENIWHFLAFSFALLKQTPTETVKNAESPNPLKPLTILAMGRF
jgi:hypothetical protein